MQKQKTYWHLLELKRMPSEYEISTSRLHYYTAKGFEVAHPLKEWYEKYQKNSPFTCSNWKRFYDPRETTYTRYTKLQSEKEIFTEGIFQSIDFTGYDKALSKTWLETLSKVFAPLRYPLHGFQMLASYIGQMAPSGRITIAALFQAADEIRRVQCIAYRIRQLQQTYPDFAKDSKHLWEKDSLWQPLRKAVEKLLVTYDWGEAFAGLNLVLKPLVDELFMTHFSELAAKNGDPRMSEILYSLNEDSRWQREWTKALVSAAVEDTPENRKTLEVWSEKWYLLASDAVRAFEPEWNGCRLPSLSLLEVQQLSGLGSFRQGDKAACGR